MAGHGQHRLGHQAQAALLHHGGGKSKSLAATHSMSQVGAAGRDDAPDAAPLMSAKRHGSAGARQHQVDAREVPIHQVVKQVVVNTGQAVGACVAAPYPAGESVLDLSQLLFDRFGCRSVEDRDGSAFVVLHIVIDGRNPVVQRVLHDQPGVPARGSPFGGCCRRPGEARHADRPGGDLRGVNHAGGHADHFDDEGHHVGCRYPRRTQACGDVCRVEVGGLHQAQGVHVALPGRVAGQRRLGCGQLAADGARQVGIIRLPFPCCRV